MTYKFETTNFGVQAKGLIGVADAWRIAPAVSYFIGDEISYSIDVDMQYELLTFGENVNVFPIAGLNWSEYADPIGSDIGLNIGAFSDFRLNQGKLHIYVEPKFLISDSSSFIFSAGVMF